MGNAAAAGTSDPSALLKVEKTGAVMTVGLNRPAKRNALNDGIIDRTRRQRRPAALADVAPRI